MLSLFLHISKVFGHVLLYIVILKHHSLTMISHLIWDMFISYDTLTYQQQNCVDIYVTSTLAPRTICLSSPCIIEMCNLYFSRNKIFTPSLICKMYQNYRDKNRTIWWVTLRLYDNSSQMDTRAILRLYQDTLWMKLKGALCFVN